MRIAPLIAIAFAFFLIAIYPIYSEDNVDENLTYSDEDNDGIPSDKDKCPEENASGKDIDEDGCIDSEITKEEVDYLTNKYRDIAQFYTNNFTNFMVYNQDTYPEYNANTEDDFYPDQSGADFGGWAL